MLSDLHLSEHNMILRSPAIWKWFLDQIQSRVKHWTSPASAALAAGFVVDLTRNKVDLLIENVLLRQQLIVLER